MVILNRATMKSDFNTDDIKEIFPTTEENGEYEAYLQITRHVPVILHENTYVPAYPINTVVFQGTRTEVEKARQVLRNITNWQSRPSVAFEQIELWHNRNEGVQLTSTTRAQSEEDEQLAQYDEPTTETENPE